MALLIMLLAEAATARPLLPSSQVRDGGASASEPLQPPVIARRECRSRDGGEIVVCGSRDETERYRLPRLESGFESSPVKAEAALGGGVTGKFFMESSPLPNGMISNRVMIGIKTKF